MFLRRAVCVALRGFSLIFAVSTFGCASRSDARELVIDGSTTAYPIVSAMGEDFGRRNPEVIVVVNRSGTGSGFQKFLRGEVDIATASRPIKPEENAALARNGIDYLELPIAFDGVSVVVNPQNDWVRNLTVPQLRRIWRPGSSVRTWRDIDPSYPDERINFYGPTDNHGTYEYFTEAAAGKLNEIRADYQPNPEYTAIIQAVAGDRNGMGYVGFSYYDTNRDKVRAVRVDDVPPTDESIRDGRYTPLARPLFMYVSVPALRSKPAVKQFLAYATSSAGLRSISEARYVMLPDRAYALVRQRIESRTVGSVFVDSPPGMRVETVLRRESSRPPGAAR